MHFQSSQTVIELGYDNALSVDLLKGCLRCQRIGWESGM